ncbi:sulfatase-like hydrolase/transferase (plasmid) [Thioclava litoralis]|uniref:Sulfatase-like hydrolase/transferase n=1 Tax=Thioclava litoralis TaxID=3076557 RepID=A0ABZ1E5X1_9RHOB|nr:sulfatase-like hydrolase/transferase [Thioclava sp. FTW29]
MSRPNILFISLDDAFAYWRFRDVFGVRLQTPNLDRICAQGTAFHQAYCQVPVCGPSRASFLSGLAPHQTGIFDNYSEIFELLRPDQMWSYRLKAAGYYCATAGKLHHGYIPRPPEIHEALYSHEAHPCLFGPRSSAPSKDYGGGGRGIGTTDTRDDSRYYDHFSSQDAVEFLTSYQGPAPFYREAGFHNPHPPFKTPARFKEMYDEDAFTMPEGWEAPDDAFARRSFPPNLDLKNDRFWRKTVRNYFSAYSHADYHIGRVWDALQASGHAGNTITIIGADHGYHMGDKGRFRKYTLWEEAAGVPLIIHDPRQAPQVVEDPVAMLDVGPTVLDYAGLAPMRGAAGRSLRPQVEGAQVEGRAVPSFWFGSAAIRQGDHRYIAYQDGSDRLYDLRTDPWQMTDLADDPARARLRETLEDTCRDYGLSMGASEAPALYTSVPEGGKPPATPPTNGVISFEAPDPATPAHPGWRRYFIRPREDMELTLPEAYRELYYAGDIGDGAETLTVNCNDLGCHLDFVGGHKRFHLVVRGGRGDDRIETAHETLHLTLLAGRNRVEAGFSDTEIHGGSGHDAIDCQRGGNVIYGGSGSLEVTCGSGHDVIHTAAVATQITGGTGRAEIHLNAGRTHVTLPEGQTPEQTVFHVKRTGLPQRITGYAGGRIDLSDWAGGYRLQAEGPDVRLSSATESLLFDATTVELVQAGIDRTP